jgi:hypothetical protein
MTIGGSIESDQRGEKSRRGVEQMEAGDTAGVEQIDEAREAGSPDTDAVEQEAADRPEQRGLTRRISAGSLISAS